MKRYVTAAALAAATSVAAFAAAADPSSSWQFEGRLYLWVASANGTTATGQDVDIGFGDIIDALDFGAVAGLSARKGRWSVFGDFQYSELSDGDNAAVGPGIPVTVDADVEALIFTGAIGYDTVQTESYRLTPFAGFRYLDGSGAVNLAVGGGSARVTNDRTNLDGIIGLQGGTELSEKWGLTYYADVGAGDSDITWQLAATLDYSLNETWTLSFGYRHLAWEFGDPVALRDLAVGGPIFGTRINF